MKSVVQEILLSKKKGLSMQDLSFKLNIAQGTIKGYKSKVNKIVKDQLGIDANFIVIKERNSGYVISDEFSLSVQEISP